MLILYGVARLLLGVYASWGIWKGSPREIEFWFAIGGLREVFVAPVMIAAGIGLLRGRAWAPGLAVVALAAMAFLDLAPSPAVLDIVLRAVSVLALLYFVFSPDRKAWRAAEVARLSALPSSVPRITIVSRTVGVFLILLALLHLQVTSGPALGHAIAAMLAGNAGRFHVAELLPIVFTAAMVASAAGLALRRRWGRQLAAVVCTFGLVSVVQNLGLQIESSLRGMGLHFGTDVRAPQMPFALIVISALVFVPALAYAFVPPRRKAIGATDSVAPASAAVPHAVVPSRIADSPDWRTALLTSLRCTGVDAAPLNRAAAFVLPAIGIVVALVLLFVGRSFLQYELRGRSPDTIIVLQFAWSALSLLVIARLLYALFRRIWRIRARRAIDELERANARRPVLYLRSFVLDDETSRPSVAEILIGAQPTASAEQRLAKVLGRCGPVIAIGRPGEGLPGLGAARFYVTDALWQEKIADAASVSQLVTWTTGTTHALRWEIAQLLASIPLERLIVWAHPHLLSLDPVEREAEWSRFRAALGSVFPRPLPERLGKVRFFHFDPSGEPIGVAPTWGWIGWLLRPLRDAQTVALRALLRAKEVAPFDRAGRARRRRNGLIALAAVAAILVVVGGVYGSTVWLKQRENERVNDRMSWHSVARDLIGNEFEEVRDGKTGRTVRRQRAPADILRQHKFLLERLQSRGFLQRNWLEVSSAQLARLRSLVERYVATLEDAQRDTAIVALVYYRTPRLLTTVGSGADAQARLAVLSSVRGALSRFESDWNAGTAGDTLALRWLRDVTSARQAVLEANAALLDFLIANAGAWSTTGAGDTRVPVFANSALQSRFDELRQADAAAQKRLYDTLLALLRWEETSPAR